LVFRGVRFILSRSLFTPGDVRLIYIATFKSFEKKGKEYYMQHKPQKFALAVIWLLVAVLFTVPTVWGKAVKDGKAAAPSPAPTMQVQSLDNPEFIKQLKKAAGITWRTVDERKVLIDQAKKAESAINSVYEAASSLAFESPFFAPGVLAETAVANFDTGGTSFYDLNANDRNPRQIAIVPGSRLGQESDL
jgi:hypothetical protein